MPLGNRQAKRDPLGVQLTVQPARQWLLISLTDPRRESRESDVRESFDPMFHLHSSEMSADSRGDAVILSLSAQKMDGRGCKIAVGNRSNPIFIISLSDDVILNGTAYLCCSSTRTRPIRIAFLRPFEMILALVLLSTISQIQTK